MVNNYSKSLYRDFEELTKKFEAYEKKSQKEISELKEEIKDLKQTIVEKDELIDKLIEDRDRYKNQSNKNSSNSSKPSSTDMYKPKKTGPNLYNSRIKSNKKLGGEFGHKGHSLSKEYVEEKIKEGKIKVIDITHEIHGNPTNSPIIKYRLGIKTETIAERHIFYYSEKSDEKLPEEYYTDVTYTAKLKSLALFMDVHNVLSVKRLTEFFSVITNGVINLSQGTIINFLREFSKKSEGSIDNIIDDILNDRNLFTDETVEKICKRNGFVRNYSNNDSVVYKSHYNKGHAPIKEDNILTRYVGTVMGDHDTTLDSYGSKRIECNVHLGRYTVEITENTFDAPWAEKMKVLLETGNDTRKYAKMYGIDGFNGENFEYYSKKFDEIILEAKEETKHMKSSFYKKKSKTLYTRLEKNKDKHLAFLKDFTLPYSNNLSESDLRLYKIKLKVSGAFRSKEGSNYFADALSIIKTSKKRGENILNNIERIYLGETLFAN